MPTNKPNSISSLRGRFDPHYKLSGKVEGLEKGVSDQVSQIHKTISKSFVTQRKTLARVLGLEKRVNHLEIQEAAEEQAKENLDDLLEDIVGDWGPRSFKVWDQNRRLMNKILRNGFGNTK